MSLQKKGDTLLTGPWQIAREDKERCRAEIETVERGDDLPDQGYPVAVVYWGTSTEERLAQMLVTVPELIIELRNIRQLARDGEIAAKDIPERQRFVEIETRADNALLAALGQHGI